MATPAPTRSPKVDAYIVSAQPFAHPILVHIRELVHKANPEIEEAIKWSMPFFLLRGVILCHMAAFKQHCSLGLWGSEIQSALKADGYISDKAMGTFGRLATLADLPPDKQLLGYFKQAAALVSTGQRTTSLARKPKAAKPAVEIPPEFGIALKSNSAASKVFNAFSPSCQREYTAWIAEAKRPETRDRRIAQSIEWIAEGKQRMWKYQNC